MGVGKRPRGTPCLFDLPCELTTIDKNGRGKNSVDSLGQTHPQVPPSIN